MASSCCQNQGKARFTAPSSGQYSFSGQFQVSQSGMTSGVQVVYNSQTVTLMNPRQVQTFSFTRTMNAGQIIEFEVDAMGNTANDGTNLSLTVSYTPPSAWQTGEWGQWNSTCSASATRTRTVQCLQGATVVADSNCTEPKPATSETQEITTSCTYNAEYEPLTEWTECADSLQTREETMTCIRSDNTAVPVSFCGESGSSLSKTVITSQACLNKALWAAGEWQPWSTQCGNATRSRDVICQRDGNPVAEDQCVDPKPSMAEASEIYTGCTYQMITAGQTEWSICANGQQTRQVTQVCQRSDGTNVDIAFCGQTQNVFEQSQTCQDPNEEGPGDNNGGGENGENTGGNTGGSSGGNGGTNNPPAQTGDVIVFRRKLPGT
jgi:hypothetical protein